MESGTPISRLEDVCKQNRSEIAALQRGQIETIAQIGGTQERLGSVETSVKNIEKMLRDSLKLKQPIPEYGTPSDFSAVVGDWQQPRWPKGVKTELPMFDGEGVEEWTFRARKYFEVYAVPEAWRVRMLSFHMTGPAYTWYRWCVNNSINHTWESFLDALCVRFGRSIFHDPKAALKELKQVTTVAVYQHQFEELSNQVTGLSEEWLTSLFVAGLLEALKCELMLAKPRTYVEAVVLAKLHEQKFQASNLNLRPHRSRTMGSSQPAQLGANRTPPPRSPSYTPSATGMNTASEKSSNMLPSINQTHKHLSTAEIKQRRDKGLCYYCDEKYSRGHKCKSTYLLLVGGEELEELTRERTDEDKSFDLDINSPQSSPEEGVMEISFNAMVGAYHPETIQIAGTCDGHPVMVLVDGGSTHNFMKAATAQKLCLPLTPVHQLNLYVGNGECIGCASKCSAVPLHMQGYGFRLETFILDIKGADVVLGAQWLMQLSDVMMKYMHLTMEFKVSEITIKLQGERLFQPGAVRNRVLNKMVSADVIASFLHLRVVESMPTTELSAQDEEVQLLLDEYQEVFKELEQLPPQRKIEHQIHLLPETNPVNVRPYRYPYFQKEEIEKLVDEMMQAGVIRESHSAFSSPVLLVRKKDGSWRFCVDYRALNAITIKDKFPIPTIDEILDELYGAAYFSKIDLRSGYHQIRVRDEDIHKTAFWTHLGHYEFVVMPFGLTNAPSTFQATMNKVFKPHLRKFIAVFFDDILVYSRSREEHLVHLRIALSVLQQHHFVAKFSKCAFCQEQVEYLGHVVTKEGVQVDTSKIMAIVEWPRPTTLKQLRGFLGLTGYYRRFVASYAHLATPLTELLKRFERLKLVLTQTPVLALPNFSLPFTVETDASSQGIRAVLSQQGHPIAYFSKKLNSRLRVASAYVRELYAITQAVAKWCHYLLGHRFYIKTDHQGLRELMNQVVLTLDQQFYLTKLLGYDFEVVFRSGKTNHAADALSRQDEDVEVTSFQSFSTVQSSLLPSLLHATAEDQETQLLIS
ncbi:uncharacterized protein LOC110280433 [Arachis duranensis]|uniref:Uncharacterized protein LOC110280433 n=1 Tax=Arachis duranensis TaxID=130453 RepID=A0A6P5NKM8_ARADU|nr:uncharacterized protein LOC110280433 [Arachis duranensis]